MAKISIKNGLKQKPALGETSGKELRKGFFISVLNHTALRRGVAGQS